MSQGGEAAILPPECLGTGSGGSTRLSAEVWTAGVEMLIAGRDPPGARMVRESVLEAWG